MSGPLGEPTGARGAVVSRCGVYRWLLWRLRKPERRRALFIGFNPSTADGRLDDPTVRRCFAFAAAAGAGGFELVNLYAFRATHPHLAMIADDPVGHGADVFIEDALGRCETVIAAWGALVERPRKNVLRHETRIARILQLARRNGRRLHCLGTTAAGSPRHPLFVPSNTPLQEWRPPCGST